MTDKAVDFIAKCAHEVNRAYCLALGDKEQPPWNEAPEWQKESARAGVRAHMANPHMTAKQAHETWLAHKAADGWTWGPVKDAAAKTHPSFVPYDKLPVAEQAKDFIFRAIVRSLLDGLETQPARVVWPA